MYPFLVYGSAVSHHLHSEIQAEGTTTTWDISDLLAGEKRLLQSHNHFS